MVVDGHEFEDERWGRPGGAQGGLGWRGRNTGPAFSALKQSSVDHHHLWMDGCSLVLFNSVSFDGETTVERTTLSYTT